MNSPHARHVVAAALCLAAQTWAIAAFAQVTDAERAVARQLFREGDDLQRAGKIAEALDRFQRAEQAYAAPTNMLRIAECQAALGRLVESAESYRTVLRSPVPEDAPAPFRAALEQAKGELAQVEPRIPKLRVVPEPARISATAFRIDGQAVSAALLGERIPLDPGPHRVQVSAPGYASGDATEVLRERDDKTLHISLVASSGTPPAAVEAPLPVLPVLPPSATSTGDAAPPAHEVPAPPVYESPVPAGSRPPLNRSVLIGAHLGVTFPTGTVPTDRSNGTSTDIGNASLGGLAVGLDVGVRVARRWYVGGTLEHAELGQAHGAAAVLPTYGSESSNTSLLELVAGFIANPDKPSFFGEVGVGVRWYTLVVSPGAQSAAGARDRHQGDLGPEFTLGGGIWIPAGRNLRLLPELTAGFGTFQTFGGSEGQAGHVFISIGLAGFFNADF